MSNRATAAAILAVILIFSMPWTVPLLTRGINDFKTFLEMQSLLNRCDGAGSPGC